MCYAVERRIKEIVLEHLGHTRWVIPDMYMKSGFAKDKTPSHESVSFLNTGERNAVATVMIMLNSHDDRQHSFQIMVPAKKSVQLRMDKLDAWQIKIPFDNPYSMMIESDLKIVVEYARFNWIDGNIQSFGLIPYGEN